MPARPKPTAIPLTRRGLVVGGLAGAALAMTGCDAVTDLFEGDDDPGASGAVTPTAPAVDADSDLVAEVIAAIAATGALATAVGSTVPALAPAATRLARLHQVHATKLGGAPEPAAPDVPAAKGAALRRLLHAEERLQDRLVAAALAAESGALAQVLAAMAAAIAQQRAVLA